MLNKKQIIKTVLRILPAVIGLAISFNELNKIDKNITNTAVSTVNILNASLEEIEKNAKATSEQIKKVESVVSEVSENVEKVVKSMDVDIKPIEVVVISNMGLNVRKDANIESEIVDVYPYAKTITVSKEKADWYKTEEGYISKEYVMEKETAIKAGLISVSDIEEYKRLYEDYKLELNKSITGISGLSVNDILVYTNKYPGLRGIEQAVIKAEYDYGVNAFLTIAVATLESGYGKSDIARDKNNLYGMNAQDHNPYELAYTYTSKYDSVMDFAKRINKYYISRGLTNLDSIQKKYCPTNPNWDEIVNNVMNNIYNIIDSAR